MLIRRAWRWSRVSVARRLAILASLLLLLPTVALFGLQFHWLLEFQSKTEIATRETVRQTLSIVSLRLQDSIERLADRVCGSIAAVDGGDVAAIERSFLAARAEVPEIAQLFLVSEPRHHVVLLDPGAGQVRRIPPEATGAMLQAALVVHHAQYMSRSRTGGLPTPGGLTYFQPSSRGDLYVFRTVNVGGAASPTLEFVGFTLRHDALVKGLLRQAAQGVLTPSNLPAPADGGIALTVLDEHGDAMARVPGQPVTHDAAVMVGPMLPGWSLAGGFVCGTAAEIARTQFLTSLAITALVLMLFALGLAVTFRATMREATLSQLKASFVSNVSHEMKTPLALIRLFSETLELGRVEGADKRQEYYRVIHRESRRLSALVDNVLDFSRMEAGRREYRFEEADVGALVEEVVANYEEHLSSAGFAITVEIPEGLPTVRADAAAICQALLNLLDNAVKYSGAARRITVRVSASQESLDIAVTDAGIGIEKAHHARIFETFYRVDTDEVRATRGSGLGLALTRHIVEAHGGRVTVQSAPGEGSRFTIHLPVRPAAAAV